MEDQEPRDADESDELEAAIMQTDHAFGAESVGTTAEEGLEGESLDQRLAEERPERPSIDEALSVVDEGLSDDEIELVGDAVTQREASPRPRRRRCPYETARRAPRTTTILIPPTRAELEPRSRREGIVRHRT